MLYTRTRSFPARRSSARSRLAVDRERADARLEHQVVLVARGDQPAAVPQDAVPQRRHQILAVGALDVAGVDEDLATDRHLDRQLVAHALDGGREDELLRGRAPWLALAQRRAGAERKQDRKSTRLNSSH